MTLKKWMAATVLVTGATGFFGGWLVRALHARGARVVAIVRTPKPQSQFSLEGYDEQVQVESGNVYDAAFMRDVIRRTRPDYFFHAAYGADVNRVMREPLECFRSSVQSTWIALEAIRQANYPCVSVISSSDKAYGSQTVTTEEDKPLRPVHPYEVCKASLDLAAQSYGKIYGMPIAVTRCGNYFGPYDFNYTRLIPGIVRSLIQGDAPTLRSDGRFTRDFLYVEDAVEAHLLLAERLSENSRLYGEAFNFSYGEQIEVIEIVRQIIEISGTHIDPVVADNVRSEIRHMQLSSEKSRQLLDWTPRVGFDEGLRRTVAWYAAHLRGQTPTIGSNQATSYVT